MYSRKSKFYNINALNDFREIYHCIIILVSVCRFSTIPICKDYIKFLFVKFITFKQAQRPQDS